MHPRTPSIGAYCRAPIRLLEQDGGITLVEIKSGQTFSPGWMAALSTVQRHMRQPTRNAVLYGGELSADRAEASMIGWSDLVRAG